MENNMKSFMPNVEGRRPNAVIFMSGSGSNAEQILKKYSAELAAGKEPPFHLRALVTDAPATSRTAELAETYKLPMVSEDILEFYRAHGEKRVSIATEQGRAIRQAWTDALRAKLAPLNIDFAIFAGFVPLTNLTGDFPCLNVHPGDLTYLKNDQRWLVGLHTIPVERAILEGLDYMRSSVIQAIPYTGQGDDMDNGAILGISSEVDIDLCGHSLEELMECAAKREPKRPVGGYKDILAEVSAVNQNKLKEGGDWVVLPGVVWDFAANRFAIDDGGKLLYRVGQNFMPVETVVYDTKTREPIFRS